MLRDEIKEIMEELRPDLDMETETDLIDQGTLDSFDIISLVSELNDAFDIHISVEDLVPENLNTLDAMVQLVERHQQED